MLLIQHLSFPLLLLLLALENSHGWVIYPPRTATTTTTTTTTTTAAVLSSCTSDAGRKLLTIRHTNLILYSTKETESEKKENSPSSSSSETSSSNDNKNISSTATTEKEETPSQTTDGEDDDDDEDDDDEYEYIEYDTLTEVDFLGSEWLVGTVFDSNMNDIKETWVRLAANDDKNIAIWGDNAEGTWSLDVASQFLAISKENIFGKKIWAGVVDDYYFVQGTVRGWTYLTPASVLGQWQAKRLGVDPDEAGTPPWFQVPEEQEEDQDEISTESA